ncbi:MAG TPA: hypothetical protein VJB14_18075 [Planctomycetota bacterium]|nr:hypothetical protein [Planctomycetota bacterium]
MPLVECAGIGGADETYFTEAPAPCLNLERLKQGSANTRPLSSGTDVAKLQVAAGIEQADAAEEGVQLRDNDMLIRIREPLPKVIGGLVPQPAFQGRRIVLVVRDAELKDRFTKQGY